MFYNCLGQNPEQKETIKNEWNSASAVGNIRFGDTHIIQGNVFYKKYLRYDEINRIFIRLESGEYGDIQLDDFSVVFITDQGEAVMKVERRQAADRILEYFKSNYPLIPQGKY